ncbi:M6 family metalloprotease domain-containing protein, partial [Streptomyces pathocidini]|uniref:M6 family metalloprotease domain-containing protein n=1 Tax=Streptomyces pathocidini TaxID=1650571 RepID=UPI001F0A82E6
MRVPHRGVRRPRRGTALIGLAALALTAPTAATATTTFGAASGVKEALGFGTAGPPAAGRAQPDATCSPGYVEGVQMSEGLPTAPGSTRSTGTVRALNLMIDFPDTKGAGSARKRLAEFFPRTSQWYATSSYGRLDYQAHAPITDWLRMPRPFHAYGIDRGVGYEPGYRRLARDITRAADGRVDFASYDLVNILVTPNAGPPALDSVLSVTFAGVSDAPRADGATLRHMSFIYSRQDDGTETAGDNAYRVLPHENAHSLGLPDLYTARGGTKAGHWDIMSEDWGANNDFLAWHKRKLGWLTDAQVACAKGTGPSDHRVAALAGSGAGSAGA